MSWSRLLFFLMLISLQPVCAQTEQVNDAAVWIGFNLQKKLSKKFELNLSQQFRFNYNVSELGRSATAVGFSYKLNRNFRFSTGYVYMLRRQEDETFKPRHRYFLAFHIRKKFGRWLLLYRNQTQAQIDQQDGEESGKAFFNNRNRFMMRYSLTKRTEPYASYEIFYPFDQSRKKGFNSERYAIGFSRKWSKKLNSDFYFMFRRELNAFNETERDFIYGFNLGYRL
jgi:hypothetical protein